MDQDKLKILVVDDEEDISHFTGKILEKEGFISFKATNGTMALDIFDKEQPEIAVIDVDLGYSEIDGLEVLKKIKEANQRVECIMITRITDKDTVDRAKKLGARYLNKPLDWQDWVKEIHDVADNIKKRA